MSEKTQDASNRISAAQVLQLIARAMGCGKTVSKKYMRYNYKKIAKDFFSKKKNGKRIFTPLTKKTLGAIMYTALDINDFDRKSKMKFGSNFMEDNTYAAKEESGDKPYEQLITAKHLATRCKYVVELLGVLQFICNPSKRYRIKRNRISNIPQNPGKKGKDLKLLKLKAFPFGYKNQAYVLDYMNSNQYATLEYWKKFSNNPKSKKAKEAVKKYIDSANRGELAKDYINDFYCRLFLYTFFLYYFKMINYDFDFSKEARELFVKIIATQPFYDKIYKGIDNSLWEHDMEISGFSIAKYKELSEDNENEYVRQYYATDEKPLYFQLSNSAPKNNENEFLISLCDLVGSTINDNSLEKIGKIIKSSFKSQSPYLKSLDDILKTERIGKLFLRFLLGEGIISFKYDNSKTNVNLVEKFKIFCLNENVRKKDGEREKKLPKTTLRNWKV